MANASLSHEPPRSNHQLLSNAGPYKYHGKAHPHRDMSAVHCTRAPTALFSREYHFCVFRING